MAQRRKEKPSFCTMYIFFEICSTESGGSEKSPADDDDTAEKRQQEKNKAEEAGYRKTGSHIYPFLYAS